VGGLRCVVIHVKCDPHRLRGYGAVGVENGPFLLLWPVAYTTACTTVQAVIQ